MGLGDQGKARPTLSMATLPSMQQICTPQCFHWAGRQLVAAPKLRQELHGSQCWTRLVQGMAGVQCSTAAPLHGHPRSGLAHCAVQERLSTLGRSSWAMSFPLVRTLQQYEALTITLGLQPPPGRPCFTAVSSMPLGWSTSN